MWIPFIGSYPDTIHILISAYSGRVWCRCEISWLWENGVAIGLSNDLEEVENVEKEVEVEMTDKKQKWCKSQIGSTDVWRECRLEDLKSKNSNCSNRVSFWYDNNPKSGLAPFELTSLRSVLPIHKRMILTLKTTTKTKYWKRVNNNQDKKNLLQSISSL